MKKLFMTVLTLISLIGCTTENSVKTSSVAESSEVDVKNGVLMDKTFYNPLDLRQNMGDPWVFKHEGYYYYLHGGSNIRVIKSKWLTQLTPNINDANQSKIIFNQKSIDVVEVWAPELFFFEGHWYLYFTATQDIANTLAKDTARRTYGAKSKTADCFGEWEKAVKIDLPLDYRSIDATFMNYNGHQYIIYSGWPNATNSDWLQNLYITELEEGNPLRAKSTDEEARVLISEPQYEWEVREARQNEGPAYVSSPSGNPTLLYSASYSGGDKYCIGYLTYKGGNILSKEAWQKGESPLMQTDMEYSEVIAPGHNSITKSADGSEDWILYHSAKKSLSGWDRQARLQKMTWNGNIPIVESISKYSSEVSLPSGEIVKRFKFEAENALLNGSNIIEVSEERASNSKAVSILESNFIQFEIDVSKNGVYALGVRYANRDSSTTTLKLNINGSEVNVFTPLTQYDDLYNVSWIYTDLYIKPTGSNVIQISGDKSIYVDCIIVDYLDK